MIQDGHDYLESWDFQGMNLNGGATLSTMSLCLKTLLSQVSYKHINTCDRPNATFTLR